MTGSSTLESSSSGSTASGGVDQEVPCEPEPSVAPVSCAKRPGVLRVVELIGRALLSVGAVVLAFLAFQLWGTAAQHHQAQNELADELARSLALHRPGPARNEATTDGDNGKGSLSFPGLDGALGSAESEEETKLGEVVIVPSRPRPAPGTPVARIQAPTIGLDKTVVGGVGRPQLQAGPGLYPISPLPGHRGNVAIAGHRTTHGSPFGELDELLPGDPIVLETVDGVFTYRIEGQLTADGDVRGHRIVEPDAVDVIADLGDSRLTLTSCHPRYSDRQRLIVTAVLEGPAVAFPTPGPAALVPDRLEPVIEGGPGSRRPDEPTGDAQPPGGVSSPSSSGLDEPLGWQLQRWPEAATWALVLVATLAPAILLRRRRRRVLALASLVVLSSYPLIELFSVVDTMAPAW